MLVNGHHFGLGLVLAVPLFLGLVGEGQAAPGDIEINQAGAMLGGITAGDLPGFPVDLNEAGNFVLTSPLDLTGETNPESVIAIRVNSPGVSIDMAGKGILGATVCTPPPVSCGPTGAGIGIQFLSGIGSIKNGIINGMGSQGIDMSAATFGIISDVGAFNNGGIGISLPSGSTAHRVTASANGGVGLKLGAGGAVLVGTAFSNGGHGIEVGDGSNVRDTIASNNGGSGIAMGAAALIDGCVANGNGDAGVTGLFGGVVRNCVTVVNTADGIHAAGSATLTNNNSYSNGGDGIDAGSNSTVIGNMVSINGAYGLTLGVGAGYQGNTANSNTTGTVDGPSAIEMGGNVCSGSATCP